MAQLARAEKRPELPALLRRVALSGTAAVLDNQRAFRERRIPEQPRLQSIYTFVRT